MTSITHAASFRALNVQFDYKQGIYKFKSCISFGESHRRQPFQRKLPNIKNIMGATVMSATSAPSNTRPEFAEELFFTDKRPVILFDGVCNL
jgi:hypothetical protein